jgi:ParB family transcriptional regulator, chromosome partitioning protein
MAAFPKIVLSRSQDIPFNKLVLSQSNVRRVKAGISIEALADSIAGNSLLQSLTVRPVLDEAGTETGMFEVPVGGRRFRALELLVAQKRMNKTAAVPCIIRTDGLAEEDSLVENTDREALHPLDQFRAFQTLREKGRGEEEIAAAFAVTPAVVRQRLRLVTVAPSLLELYAEGAMTLDQLIAFSISDDHARQERVWEAVSRSWNPPSPAQIRRLLTEGAVHASNKRAVFVGLAAYEAAGGIVLRDLFEEDGGGWLQDPALLDRLVIEQLGHAAEDARAEGWKWVEAVETLPYGYRTGLRWIPGDTTLSETEATELAAVEAEYGALAAEHEGLDELPDEIDTKFSEFEDRLAEFEGRAPRFEPEEMAIAGAFVSVDPQGRLQVERGYVRSEDEPPVPEPEAEAGAAMDADAPVDLDVDLDTVAVPGAAGTAPPVQARTIAAASHASQTISADPADLPEEDEGIRPLPERLVAELTAHRTLGLRNALADDWDAAFLSVLHAFCLPLFYRRVGDSCLEITVRSAGFLAQAPRLNDSIAARAIDARHEAWAQRLPEEAEHLWAALKALDHDGRQALFAHCAGLTVNAVASPYDRRPRALADADRLAAAIGLDMTAAGWTPTVDAYLGRVTKARILEAVREARGDAAVTPLSGLKKPEMEAAAETLLAGSGWLPDVLRTPGMPAQAASDPAPHAAAADDAPVAAEEAVAA